MNHAERIYTVMDPVAVRSVVEAGWRNQGKTCFLLLRFPKVLIN